MTSTKNIGPFREIVDWAPHFSIAGFRVAILSCGHEKIKKRGNNGRRTRCYGCHISVAPRHPDRCRVEWPESLD